MFDLLKETLENLEKFFRLVIHFVIFLDSEIASHKQVLVLHFFKLTLDSLQVLISFVQQNFENFHEAIKRLTTSSYQSK